MQYNGKEVLAYRSARMVPMSDQYPDGIYELVLTYNILYILEDECNGQYTTHFAIPVNSITRFEQYFQESRYGNDDSMRKRLNGSRIFLTSLFIAFGSIFAGSTRSLPKVPRDFLHIVYRDEYGKEVSLYFRDFNKNKYGLIKAVYKLRSDLATK